MQKNLKQLEAQLHRNPSTCLYEITLPNVPRYVPIHDQLLARSAYADPGVLNRAEWVKFVALFFNKEVEADALFSSVSSSYERLNASARAAAAAAPSPVRVAWASAQGDALHLSFATYKRQLMQVRLAAAASSGIAARRAV
jgi:hypothetical protein